MLAPPPSGGIFILGFLAGALAVTFVVIGTIRSADALYRGTPLDSALGLTPSVPQNVSVRSYDPPLASTGSGGEGGIILLPIIVGELIVRNSLQSSRETQLNSATAGHSFSPDSLLVKTIAADLEEQGYQVEMIPISRDDSNFLVAYPVTAGIDAILDIVIDEIGYARDRGCWYKCYFLPYTELERMYRPRVTARTRLVRSHGSSSIMMRTVRYNPDANRARAIQERPIEIMRNPGYEFEEFADIEESILAGEPKVIDGLEDAVIQVADAIGGSLQK